MSPHSYTHVGICNKLNEYKFLPEVCGLIRRLKSFRFNFSDFKFSSLSFGVEQRKTCNNRQNFAQVGLQLKFSYRIRSLIFATDD